MARNVLLKQNVIEREGEQYDDSMTLFTSSRKGEEYLKIDITLYENSELLSTIWVKNGEVIEESTE
ncbi:hypothetical protein [Viridibacillus arvi]|uniref:hypothetical protein n=1 Tax=Viridibacillus arvi TaxID=263475 RepID=UPI0036E409FA